MYHRVVLEETGNEVVVKKTDAVPLSAEELLSRPFNYPTGVSITGTTTGSSSDEGFTVLETKPEVVSTSSSTLPLTRNIAPSPRQESHVDTKPVAADSRQVNVQLAKTSLPEPKKKTVSGDSSSKDTKTNSLSAPSSSSSSSSAPNVNSSSMWLRPGLRVKLVSDKFGRQLYLKKGVVVDVYGDKLASVRLDSGTLLETVKQRHLETVVPLERGACVVLTGRHRGLEAVLLERRRGSGSGSGSSGSSSKESVVVQLAEEMSIVLELSLDDICAFEENIFYQR